MSPAGTGATDETAVRTLRGPPSRVSALGPRLSHERLARASTRIVLFMETVCARDVDDFIQTSRELFLARKVHTCLLWVSHSHERLTTRQLCS